MSYSISGGADEALFTIDPSSGVLSFVAGRDRENHTDANADGVYEVVVQVSDGSLTDTQSLRITILDVNEFNTSELTDTNTAVNSVAENATVGTAVGLTALASDANATTNTISYSLDDNAGGRFAIDAKTGVVTVAGAIDYESATSHQVTVRATSADGSHSTQVFTISVTDVNETSVTPTSDVDANTDYVVENAAVGTTVGITALATDADGTDAVSYSLDDNAGGRFAIDADTGVVTVSGAIDREAAGSYNITVRATSTDTSSTTQTFAITIGDVDEFDTGAVTDSDTAANAVAENAAVGTVVGLTGLASDADATTNTITYSLDDNAGGRFAIHATTGVVTVAGAIDFESATSHQVTVRATSTDGSSSTQAFTIQVANVNELPVATDDQYFLGRGETLVVEATGVLANDQDTDNDPVTAVLQSNVTHGTLVLQADGSFIYQPNPSFYGIDQFTYLTTDGALASQTVTVTLVVDDSLPQDDGGINDTPDDAVDDSSDTDEVADEVTDLSESTNSAVNEAAATDYAG